MGMGGGPPPPQPAPEMKPPSLKNCWRGGCEEMGSGVGFHRHNEGHIQPHQSINQITKTLQYIRRFFI